MRHKDKIPDLIAWKHTPDHFYFHKFFDPYSKREYEVVRTVTVNNSRLLPSFCPDPQSLQTSRRCFSPAMSTSSRKRRWLPICWMLIARVAFANNGPLVRTP